MRLVEAKSIVVPEDRQRKYFDETALRELEGSILSKGLMHPIVVRPLENTQLELVAGERRLRAIHNLYTAGKSFRCDGQIMLIGVVPVVYVTDLDEVAAQEAELEENVIRRDLLLQEQIAARKKLFELRKAKAQARGEDYNMRMFADELQKSGVPDSSIQVVCREMSVAPFLDRPEVAKATSLNEAVKAAKKSMEGNLLGALSSMMEGIPQPKHTFIAGDSLVELARLESRRYDCVLTDPPYGIGIDSSGSMVTNQHHYADGPDVLEGILQIVPDQLYRITREQAHVYWFCDLRWFAKISYELEQSGFSVCQFPIIWWKRGKAMAPDITRWPKREYECVVYAIKGDKPPLKVAGDVVATSYGSDLQQAEKPKELFVELLSRSVLAGAQVIDPFCGSGVIFSAAEELKCVATGIEIDPARGDLARIRASGEL